MTIKEFQNQTNDWIEEHGVRYFDEMTNTVLLMEEVGEFASLMARIHGQQSFKKDVDPLHHHDMLADEIADILFVLSCLANQMDIDLTAAIRSNIDKLRVGSAGHCLGWPRRLQD